MANQRLDVAPDIAEIPRLLDWIEECCAEAGLSEFSSRFALALDEAVTNVIGNAFSGQAPPHQIQVDFEVNGNSVVATVIENGKPFDPTARPEPDITLSIEERKPGGLGIMLVQRMVDRVTYHRTDGKNHLRLEKLRG
jgi:anti-sigma regulatory factor (Ser/Thr protein kinase)